MEFANDNFTAYVYSFAKAQGSAGYLLSFMVRP